MPPYDYLSIISTYADTGSSGLDLGSYWAAFTAWLGESWAAIVAWLSQPHVFAVILAWAITFTAIMFIFLSLGFGPVGVGAGTLAAAFQSYMYGGFTPPGGIFATLTSIVMLGAWMPPVALAAAVIATLVAVIVWLCGAGR